MPSNHLILCYPLFFLPSIFPSIRVFSNKSVLHIRWWSKYWNFSFSISPSNEYSGLISFRIHWFDLLAGQGILKSLLQHHSLKAGPLPASNTHGRKEPGGLACSIDDLSSTKWTYLLLSCTCSRIALLQRLHQNYAAIILLRARSSLLQSSGQGYLIFALVSEDIICRNLVRDFGAQSRGEGFGVLLWNSFLIRTTIIMFLCLWFSSIPSR